MVRYKMLAQSSLDSQATGFYFWVGVPYTKMRLPQKIDLREAVKYDVPNCRNREPPKSLIDKTTEGLRCA